ncbi:MAG TPA: hemerythrin domain-containing protein [Caulobacteraceae bacterium]|nr:hemerythrin domain-containing protein [Caulobacteraceae bacterium]
MQIGGRTNGHGDVGRLAGMAALGFVAGVAATQARKVAMQTPSIAAGDWVDALKAEHRMVEKLFQTLSSTTEGQAMKREMILAKIAYALNKHAIEEENVVYPAISHSTQHDEAGRLSEEHAQIKTCIYDLRMINPADPRWLMRAKEFERLVREHVREEEDEIFPLFQDSLSQGENAKLTTMLNWEGFKVA